MVMIMIYDDYDDDGDDNDYDDYDDGDDSDELAPPQRLVQENPRRR